MSIDALGDHFFAAFGGGPDRSSSYADGQLTGARTQEAMARARRQQQAAMAGERLPMHDLTADLTPEAMSDIVLGGYGSDYAGANMGRARQQEMGFRSTIADPATLMPDRQYAGHALAGGVQNYFPSVGTGVARDVRGDDLGALLTPTGEAMVEADQALAAQRMRARPDPLVAAMVDGVPTHVPRPDAAGLPTVPRGTPPKTPEQIAQETYAKELVSRLLEGMSDEEAAKAAAALGYELAPSAPVSDVPVPGEVGNELPPGIPPGSTPTGQVDRFGMPVFLGPDGKKWAQTPPAAGAP